MAGAALMLASATSMPADALQPDEMLADPALEARAREISKELRCVVCQNQSIDDSDAELARDLRVLVRERLEAGESNEAVMQYVVSRYGDFVSLTPPFKPATYALWFGPVAFVAVGALALVFVFRRKRQAPAPTAALTPEQERRLARVLTDEEP